VSQEVESNRSYKNVYEALAAAYTLVEDLKRSKENKFFNFKYSPIEDVYRNCRNALASVGVVFDPQVVQETISETTTSGKSSKTNHTTIVMQFQFHYGDSHTEPKRWIGEAMDTGDKSYAKAISFATKTYLIDFFLMPSGDMNDPDGGEIEATVNSKNSSYSPPKNFQKNYQKNSNSSNNDYKKPNQSYQNNNAKASHQYTENTVKTTFEEKKEPYKAWGQYLLCKVEKENPKSPMLMVYMKALYFAGCKTENELLNFLSSLFGDQIESVLTVDPQELTNWFIECCKKNPLQESLSKEDMTKVSRIVDLGKVVDRKAKNKDTEAREVK
jgi:hypothetical protein